jgi:drug/metabolite transporter (DMT)-like permease
MQKPSGGAPPANQLRDRLRAIGLIVVAVCLFACLDGTAKYLYSEVKLPLFQIVWMRFIGQFLVIVIALGAINIPRLLQTQKLKHQLLRSVLLLFSTLFNFLALRHLRLDQATTVMFLAPLTVALLAGPLIGEWVGWRRLVAILVGFCGILVVIRPGYATLQPAMLYSLCAMVSYALFILTTRYLAGYDPSENTLFYSLIVGTAVMTPLALVDWVWPADGFVWLLISSLGVWAAAGHYLFIVAHRWAPASTIAPFLYLQLITVSVFGYFVFGDVPDFWTACGSAIIIGSGIYLLHRERVTQRAAVTQERAVS